MEHFAKIGNSFQLVTIFAKLYVLDIWQGSEYATEGRYETVMAV